MKHSRKLCALVLAVCTAVLCSGCIKSDMKMAVNKNRSMDFSATYLLVDSLANMSTGEGATQVGISESSANWKALESRGYTVQKYAAGGFQGFKATRHFDSIDALSKESGVGVTLSNFLEKDFDDSALFSVRRELTKDTYTAHFVYDLKGDGSVTGLDEDSDLSAYLNSMEITYSVTLPCKADGHNATTVSEDGLTYTWKIPYGTFTAIDYSFTMTSRNVTFGLLGLAALLVIGAAVTFLVVRRKKRAVTAPENEDLPAPKTEQEAAALLQSTQQTAQKPAPAPVAPTTAQKPAPAVSSHNTCPLCGGKLTVRVAKSGPNTGASYAVCEHYPATCKFAKPIR